MIFETRILTINDIELIKSLIQSNVNKHPDINHTFISCDLITLLTESNTVIVGAFNDNKLYSTFGAYFWDTMPNTTLIMLLTDPNLVTNILFSGYADCCAKILEISENKGYYTHYSARHAREVLLSEKYISPKFEKRFPIIGKYTEFKEAYVPKYTIPKFQGFWDIMGNTTFPYDVCIHCLKLKKEYQLVIPRG